MDVNHIHVPLNPSERRKTEREQRNAIIEKAAAARGERGGGNLKFLPATAKLIPESIQKQINFVRGQV